MSDTDQISETTPNGSSTLRTMMARLEASPLNLDYAFISNPYPILASPVGGEANVIELQVLISNRKLRPVGVQKIVITIRTGENTSASISTAPNLPDPVYDRSSAFPWTITTSAGRITIEPKDELIGEITDPISFKLPGIAVNTTFGVVPVEVMELDSTGKKIDAKDLYSLTKLPSNSPVTNFRAEPSVLDDLGKPTTIYWHCTRMGESLAYSIRSANWTPKRCLETGDCFSCADGAAGVTTPGLEGSTYFELQVIGPNSQGHRVVLETLVTYVRVDTPSIVPTSSCTPASRSGQIQELKWLARNAVRCSIKMDGVVIRQNLPPNTYTNGYLLTLDAAPGQHQLSLVAYSASGVKTEHIFPNIVIGSSTTIPMGGAVSSVVVTPNGRYAYAGVCKDAYLLAMAQVIPSLAPNAASSLEKIDLTKGTREQGTPIDIVPGMLTLTRDGKYVVVAPNFFFARVSGPQDKMVALDVATNTTRSLSAPDFRILSVSSGENGSLVAANAITADTTPGRWTQILFDASGGPVDRPRMQLNSGGFGTAVTPDGKFLLVTGYTEKTLAFVDIPQRAQVQEVAVKSEPMAVAVTPDGALALVVGNDNEGMLTVVDVARRVVEPQAVRIGPLNAMRLAASLSGSWIALSRDGRRAFAIRDDGEELAIVDVPGRALVGTLRIPFSNSVTVAPDGTIILSTGSSLTLL